MMVLSLSLVCFATGFGFEIKENAIFLNVEDVSVGFEIKENAIFLNVEDVSVGQGQYGQLQ